MSAIQQIMVGNSYGGFATWNPSDKGADISLSNGNKTAANFSGFGESVRSTISKSAGKWYWECTPGAQGGGTLYIGVSNSTQSINSGTASANNCTYAIDGKIRDGNTLVTTGSTYTTGDVIGVALDVAANTVKFYKNNVLQSTVTTTIGSTYFAWTDAIGNTGVVTNFGASAQTYSPPAGYNAGLYS